MDFGMLGCLDVRTAFGRAWAALSFGHLQLQLLDGFWLLWGIVFFAGGPVALPLTHHVSHLQMAWTDAKHARQTR